MGFIHSTHVCLRNNREPEGYQRSKSAIWEDDLEPVVVKGEGHIFVSV